MFLIDIIDLFVNLDMIRYLFIAFAFYGTNLLVQKVIFGIDLL